jgi:hypothetical protein
VRRSNKGYTNSGTSKEKNIAIEYRYAAGRIDRLPEMAAELVRLHVDFIVTHYGQGVLSKQQNVMCRGNGSVKRQIITVAQRAALVSTG